MTFFNDTNDDAQSIDPGSVSLGPRVGPLESFKSSWDAQGRASAQFGIENAMLNLEQEQTSAMRKAGIENIPRLSPEQGNMFEKWSPYLDTAKFYEDGGDDTQRNILQEYDKRIEDIRKKYPSLQIRNSRELWDTVRTKGQEAERKNATLRTTFMGDVGGFVGGALSSLNPNTDPLNFATLGVGAVGKTAGMRIASQVGAQGVIETVNQITGVQKERQLLGLENGFSDAFTRVAGTAIGAGVLQGAGEAVALAGKRWFRSTATDVAPAPPVPKEPLLLEYKPKGKTEAERLADAQQEQQSAGLAAGRFDYRALIRSDAPDVMTPRGPASRMMRSRDMADLSHVENQLQSWSGDLPDRIVPKADTAIPKAITDFNVPEVRIDSTAERVDEIARSVDPQAFRIYDTLASRREEYRRWLDEMRPAGRKLDEAVAAFDDKIEALSVKIDDKKTSAKTRRFLEKERAQVVAQRKEEVTRLTTTDTPGMSRVRQELIKTDEQMRDLAPVIGRAYARARNQWELGAEDRAAVRSMLRYGAKKLPQTEGVKLPSFDEAQQALFPKTLVEKAPILQQAPKVEAQMRDGADGADYAAAIVRDNMKVLDDAIEAYRSTIDGLINEKTGKVEIAGQEYKLDLDKDRIAVPHESGEGGKMVTVRELLEDNAETEFELKAVQTCSIGKK